MSLSASRQALRPRTWPMSHVNRFLVVILVVYACLCLAYSVTVPLGEAPDELAHYRYVRYIDEVGHAPLTPGDRQDSGYKGHEPPLYYLLLHRTTSFLRIAQRPMLKLIDPDQQPRHSIGAEVMLWNAVLHTADESFPWRGTSLAWHLMRLISIPLGMVTILCTYSTVRFLFPQRPLLALLSAGLNAFIPQFIYVSAVLNNDNLAVPLAVLSLWVLVHLASGDLRWRWFVLLGILIGLARITKFYTLILLPIIFISLFLIAWRRKQWRRSILGGLLVLGLTIALSAPWIMLVQPDNPAEAPGGLFGFALKMLDILHTDRIFRSRGMSATEGGGLMALLEMALSFFRLEPGRWATLLFRSFWAYYGPMTVAAPSWVYVAMLGLLTLALAGWLRYAISWRSRKASGQTAGGLTARLPLVVLGLQALSFLLLEALFYTIMRRLPDTAQGRHLYSAMPAWVLFLAGGLEQWVVPRPRRGPRASYYLAGVLPLALAALSAYALPNIVLAAYEPSLPVRTDLPKTWKPAEMVAIDCAPGVRYIGSLPQRREGVSGQEVTWQFVWQATAPIGDEYLLRIDAVDRQGVAYLLRLAHPLNGRWPTRAWDPGDYVQDEQALFLPPGIAAGSYTLRCTWVDNNLRPLGRELEAGVLDVVWPPAQRATRMGDLAQADLKVHGPSSGVLRYRQAFSVTTVTPNGVSQGRDPYMAWVMQDGTRWLPLTSQSFPSGESKVVQSFYLVTGHILPGRYVLTSPSGGVSSTNRADVVVEGRARAFTAPERYTPWPATLGEQLELVGYRLEGATWPTKAHPVLGEHYAAIQPGQTLNLLLAWRATNWVPRSYTVFTHLLDERRIVRAQHDQVPQFSYSTLFWVPGEVVMDVYHLTLPSDAPVGIYSIEVGFYDRLDDARLPVRGPHAGDDAYVALPRIQVGSE